MLHDLFTQSTTLAPTPLHKENNNESMAIQVANKAKINKQCQRVYDALLRGETLTAYNAMLKYKVGHLARRIKDLKDYHNVPIVSETVAGGHKEYWLKKD